MPPLTNKTKEPAAEPLPGPKGISFALQKSIFSNIFNIYGAYPFVFIISNS